MDGQCATAAIGIDLFGCQKTLKKMGSYIVNHPADVLGQMIDWEDWSHGRYARAAGHVLPSALVTVATFGTRGAAAKGGEAVGLTEAAASTAARDVIGTAAEGGVRLEASAAARAAEQQGMLPAGSAGRVTMGFGYARDAEDGLEKLVGTSEPGGYLRPGVTLNDGEIIAPGMGRAEQDIIAYAQANNWEMVTVAAGRSICPMCVDKILGSGATTASALR